MDKPEQLDSIYSFEILLITKDLVEKLSLDQDN